MDESGRKASGLQEYRVLLEPWQSYSWNPKRLLEPTEDFSQLALKVCANNKVRCTMAVPVVAS